MGGVMGSSGKGVHVFISESVKKMQEGSDDVVVDTLMDLEKVPAPTPLSELVEPNSRRQQPNTRALPPSASIPSAICRHRPRSTAPSARPEQRPTTRA